MSPRPPVEILEQPVGSGLVLLGDHATNYLPPEYGDLGLGADQFERHIAYDIGTEALIRTLSARLGVPAVMSQFSRLLIDPNRGLDDPTLVMKLSDGTVIPGNHPISDEEVEKRITHFYKPYHAAIDAAIRAEIASGNRPMILSVHSFTDRWKEFDRPWHAAMLWDSDARFPKAMLSILGEDHSLVLGDNQPYDGALKNDTMYRHCTARGLAQGLIEIRQDLISTPEGVAEWVDRLEPALIKINTMPQMHEEMFFASRSD